MTTLADTIQNTNLVTQENHDLLTQALGGIAEIKTTVAGLQHPTVDLTPLQTQLNSIENNVQTVASQLTVTPATDTTTTPAPSPGGNDTTTTSATTTTPSDTTAAAPQG